MKALCLPFSLLILAITFLGCGTESPGATINPKTDTTSIVDPGNNTPDNNVVIGQDLTQQVDNNTSFDTNIPPTTLQRACGIKNTGIGTKLIGSPCNAHEECSTGYCYDEWYLSWAGGFRFCTIACNGCDSVFNSCNDWNDQSPGRELKCNIVSNGCTKQENPGMQVLGFCVPTCVNTGQCIEAYGPGSYTSCEQSNIPECGSFGHPNKVCFVGKP